jgi:hypothetical protein
MRKILFRVALAIMAVFLLTTLPIVGPASHWFSFGEKSDIAKLEASGQAGATKWKVPEKEQPKSRTDVPVMRDWRIYLPPGERFVSYQPRNDSASWYTIVTRIGNEFTIYTSPQLAGPWQRDQVIVEASPR